MRFITFFTLSGYSFHAFKNRYDLSPDKSQEHCNDSSFVVSLVSAVTTCRDRAYYYSEKRLVCM